MAAITESVEIARRPEDVFAYLDDYERHAEWQDTLVRAEVETAGPPAVGTKVRETRKMGGREQTSTYEITEHDPPRSFAFRTLDGPIRPVGRGRIDALDDGARSRVTVELDMVAHGLIGRVIRPIALRQARKEVPKNQQKLKELLESGGA